MYKAALFLNILLLFRRQARFASIGAQKKMFQPEQNTPWLEREKILHRLCFLITHEHYRRVLRHLRENMAKLWRSPTTVRKLTQNSKSSVSQPFRDTAAVCSLTAGRSRRCRAVHRRTTGRNHRRSVDSCFRIIRQKLPAFMRLSQLCMENVANASWEQSHEAFVRSLHQLTASYISKGGERSALFRRYHLE